MTKSTSRKVLAVVAHDLRQRRSAPQRWCALIFMCILLSAHPAYAQNQPAGPALGRRSPDDSISALILKAETLRKDGKNSEALGVIRQAISLDSDCGKCFSILSGIEGNLQQYKDGEADGAIGVLRSKTPRDKATAAYNRGFNLFGLERHSEALEAYNLSIGFDPTCALGYFGKGKTNYYFGNWNASQAALRQALARNPLHGPSWAYLAEDELFLGHPEAGMLAANQAVKLAPSDARSFRARAIANLSANKFEEMLKDETRTLELDPARYRAHLLRGHALKALGRESEAAKEYALEPGGVTLAETNAASPTQRARAGNCGIFVTELATPMNPNTGMFDDCVKRLMQNPESSANNQSAAPTTKRKIPSQPIKKPSEK